LGISRRSCPLSLTQSAANCMQVLPVPAAHISQQTFLSHKQGWLETGVASSQATLSQLHLYLQFPASSLPQLTTLQANKGSLQAPDISLQKPTYSSHQYLTLKKPYLLPPINLPSYTVGPAHLHPGLCLYIPPTKEKFGRLYKPQAIDKG
jgi:hypothetical protein